MTFPLAQILQRVPAISHLLIILIASYGPGHFPFIYATIRFCVHILLLAHQVLSAWGQFCAWKGVETICRAKVYDRHDVDHIIIIPTYKEELELLRQTLDVLASHLQTRDRYHICLAMETREIGSEKKAIQLQMEYTDVFAEIDYSMHPVIGGEAPGKSSNVNWAARHIAAKFDPKEQARQVITVIDSDTCLAQSYFQLAAERFIAVSPNVRSKMMFCVPIVFDRNAHKVPIFVRLTDILWCQAGLSTLYPSSGIKIPTSTYGISMQLACNVGFWDTGPDAIGEDMHMFTKCFLSTGGNLHVETIYSPASQLNVVGSRHGDGLTGWISDMSARYSQGMRHMWGSLDSSYAVRRVITRDLGDGPVNWFGIASLLFRLFQAHLMLGWLFIFALRDQLGGYFGSPQYPDPMMLMTNEIYTWDLLWISFCLNMVTLIRGFSIVCTITTMILYDKYHHASAVKRWSKPRAGIRPEDISLRYFPWSLIDLSAIVSGLLFGIIPLFHAQFLHLFTSKLDYTVSLKMQKLLRR